MSVKPSSFPLPPAPPIPEGVEVTERTTVFQGYFRIVRYVLRHRRFAGGWTPPITREVFERGHAAAVLLYDPVRDMVGLSEQFRVAAMAAGRHPWLIEIVAGIIDPGETAETTALREAREEAGVEVAELVPIVHAIASPGGSTETVKIFCGRVDATKLGGIHGVEAEGEDIKVFAVPADEAIAWVASGRIDNSTSIIAIQWLALHRDALRKRWNGSAT
jgi:ADP-ribose pyrophosphatase